MPETVRTARPGEVARMLGVDPKTVSRYALAGRIPFSTTPSGHKRFNLDEVRFALAQPPQDAAPPALLEFELDQIEAQMAALSTRVQAFARNARGYLTRERSE